MHNAMELPQGAALDKSLSAFMIYASRERSLDASLRAAIKYGRSDDHKKAIDTLRHLNTKMLLRETRFAPSRSDNSSDGTDR